VSLFIDQRDADIDALNTRIDELAREVSALKSPPRDDTGAIEEIGASKLASALDSALENALRRIGITIARGGSLEDAAGAVASQLERVAGRKLESWLVAEAGGGLLGALVGGAGAALFSEAIDAVVRAIKPRRLYLPEVEESPHAGFPVYAARGSIFPQGDERDDSLERSLAQELARAISEES
jgi:hypothetical protein